MDLYGKAVAPRELRRRVWRLKQVARIEPFVFDEGAQRPSPAVPESPSLEAGIALSMRFRPEELPHFVQWTMTGEAMIRSPALARRSGELLLD